MSPVTLPTSPLPQSASPTPLIFGGWQTPNIGGPEQWLGRLGNRMSLAIETPRLKPEPDGRLWTAALRDAWFSGALVRMPFPQPGFDVGTPGSIVVNGANQAGSTLLVRAATASYPFQRGQFFHIAHSGALYLHWVTADITANGSGLASLPIAPMLRIVPSDGDSCEFAAPMIEGKLDGDTRSWTMVIARVQGLSFKISEIQ